LILEARLGTRTERSRWSLAASHSPTVPKWFGNPEVIEHCPRPFLAFDRHVTRTTDALVAALEELKLRCALMTEGNERRPWTRPFPEDAMSLHVVLEGGCLIETDLDLWRYRLHDGEVLVINGTGPGALRGMSDARPPEVVSARIRLLAPLGHPMLASLPRLIQASPSPVVRSFEPSLHALREEHASRKLGREFAVTRLLEVLFVHALRAHIDALGWTDQGWFRMLADPVLRDPLAEASCATTTVAGFAAAAGRSRQRIWRGSRSSGRATLRVPPPDEGPARRGAAAGGRDRPRSHRDGERVCLASGTLPCLPARARVTPAEHWRAVHGRPFPRAPRRRTPAPP
jgi:hypothetical protein